MEATKVAVPVPCQCPGTPHPDGDTVYLRSKLGLGAGIELQRLVVEANQNRDNAAALSGKLAEAYVRLGVCGWTFVNEHAKSIPVTTEAIESLLLSDFSRGAEVADKADELYMVTVLAPLVRRAATSLPTTPTDASTSAAPDGLPKRPKRSKRSSTSTTQTVATATTSP